MSESLDKALDFATAQLASIIDAAKAATPSAVDLAMATVRISALNNLVFAGVQVAVGLIGLLVIRKFKMLQWAHKVWKEDDANPFGFLSVGLASVLPVIFFFSGVFDFFNIWNWVGLWHPELYAIHQALGVAGGHK